MVIQDRLAIIDGLLVLPFPGESMREGRRSSGPGFHVYVLQASRSFWDDRSEEIVETAQAEIDTGFRTLATALTARWGEPQTVDLEPFLWSEDHAPEPMNQLCQLSGEIFAWRPLDIGRWVALAVGHGDPELPTELLVAVGEAELLR
ncbi:hypothetical protein ACWT_5640 [Actinoplanes sp. SE50]|uniref:hypothetical protein n=1 Tax=unclassified Actinoplanes TaxID=2626549 RepID=UPI00023ED104|nr:MULTISPECIES: hypothetical protein [unclassified Actinoplanes]AEV86657.1 hypothetical protein ACPL_5770 [Actinoplanes sp. SE50/110]ATO85055.1 hypothetical protein ACWT_5640 [Actinoplanes sp. SE50]SLM02465.1 hypothetical protein ACSP50_5715 [Actinoplanes sp. SE50/110]